jgi:hypothetical protein
MESFANGSFPSGPFDWRVITPGSAHWPGGFIHFKDLSPAVGNQMILDSAGQVWAKNSIGNGGWTQETPPEKPRSPREAERSHPPADRNRRL